MTAAPVAPRPARARRRHWPLLAMLAPGLLYFFLFHYIPMGGLIIAFKDFTLADGILRSPWNGWENFHRLFTGGEFPRVLANTLAISGLRLIAGFIAPLALALLLNEIRCGPYRRLVQTLTYLPYFLSWVILGGIFIMLFSYHGPLNALAVSLGGKPIEFLTRPGWFLFVLIATGVWQSAGYGAVIYLAALSGIDPGLYEAATVDGAGRWKQLWHITLPCLVPTMTVLLILSLGGILNAGFDQIYNMQNAMVRASTDIIDTYVLRRMTSLDFSLATAAGLFKSAVGLVLVVAANAGVRRATHGEQGIW